MTMVGDAPVLRRLWIYQRERFPLSRTALLLAVFSAASINVSAPGAINVSPAGARFAVPGWTNEQTEYWLDRGPSACAGCG